jgi:DNA-binding GntR family transcriptional regulator
MSLELGRSPAAIKGTEDSSHKRPLSEVAYTKLLDLFLSGGLPPGTVLQERRLAEQLGISRTPIREAISRLAAEGLVTPFENRSPMVSKVPVQKYVQILKTRKLFEVEAAGLAAEKGLSRQLAQSGRDAIAELLQKPKPSISEHWAVDDMIHGMISDAAQNRLLATTILDLRRRTHMFSTDRLPARLRPGAAEHLAILDAVESGDAVAARGSMADHIDNARIAIVDAILAIGNP